MTLNGNAKQRDQSGQDGEIVGLELEQGTY